MGAPRVGLEGSHEWITSSPAKAGSSQFGGQVLTTPRKAKTKTPERCLFLLPQLNAIRICLIDNLA